MMPPARRDNQKHGHCGAGNDRAFGGQGAVSIAITGLLVQLPVMPACINVLTRYAVWNKISGH
ncbi:MAG: hypothetical protein ABFD62_12965 [Syntrophaceae bacterium]